MEPGDDDWPPRPIKTHQSFQRIENVRRASVTRGAGGVEVKRTSKEVLCSLHSFDFLHYESLARKIKQWPQHYRAGKGKLGDSVALG